MSTKTLMTVEEFAQMDAADTEDCELVAGELVPLSRPTFRHNEIRDLLGHLLWSYFKSNPIGKAIAGNECQLSADTVRRPDIAIFLADRLHQIDRNKSIAPLAPDIAVQILSPSQTQNRSPTRGTRLSAGGSKEVWLVDDSNGEVTLQAKTGTLVLEGAQVVESSLLPGFGVSVAELLAAS